MPFSVSIENYLTSRTGDKILATILKEGMILQNSIKKIDYPQQPYRKQVDSKKRKFILCLALIVIGKLLDIMAVISDSSAIAIPIICFYLGLFGSIIYFIAYERAEKSYKEQMIQFHNECTSIDKQNAALVGQHLQEELSTCRNRIAELQDRLAKEKRIGAENDAFLSLFNNLGTSKGDVIQKNQNETITKLQEEIEKQLMYEEELQREISRNNRSFS